MRPTPRCGPRVPALDGQWRDFSYDFRLSPQPQEIGLYIYLAGNGTLDLQRLKLVKLSEQDLIAEIKAKYPEAGPATWCGCRASRWGCRAAGPSTATTPMAIRCRWTATPEVLGPSGCPALRINAPPEGIRVYSAPFAVPWSFETHVLSLSVRGDWDGALIVAGGKGEVCADKSR